MYFLFNFRLNLTSNIEKEGWKRSYYFSITKSLTFLKRITTRFGQITAPTRSQQQPTKNQAVYLEEMAAIYLGNSLKSVEWKVWIACGKCKLVILKLQIVIELVLAK